MRRKPMIADRGDLMKKDFIVTGMTCAACSARVEKAVRALEGVLKCDVNLLAGKMQAEFDESAVTADKLSRRSLTRATAAKSRARNRKRN